MPSFRSNSRTDKELAYLRARLGTSNTSEVIVTSIHQLYRSVKNKEEESASFLDLMKQNGLVGCIEEKSDLSTSYKQELHRTLEEKYGKDESSTDH